MHLLCVFCLARISCLHSQALVPKNDDVPEIEPKGLWHRSHCMVPTTWTQICRRNFQTFCVMFNQWLWSLCCTRTHLRKKRYYCYCSLCHSSTYPRTLCIERTVGRSIPKPYTCNGRIGVFESTNDACLDPVFLHHYLNNFVILINFILLTIETLENR